MGDVELVSRPVGQRLGVVLVVAVHLGVELDELVAIGRPGGPQEQATAEVARGEGHPASPPHLGLRRHRFDGASRPRSPPVGTEVLTARALNRATLARQLLLERSSRTVLDAVAHLVGLQAQLPLNPYVGLWSRLARFDPEDLSGALSACHVVRLVLMRATLHLVTADDCLILRPLMQPVLDCELSRHREAAPALAGVDLGPVLAFARSLLAAEPRTGPALRAALAERFPERDATALAYACRNHLALVQVPPRGLWGRSGQVTTTTAEAWLARPLASRPSIDEIVVRYLGAFGPATVADVSNWSRLTGMRDVVERLRPRLRTFRDERGRELFDVPDGPRPDPDVAVPPRFLPEYDNVLLGHADRTRFFPAEPPILELASAPFRGAVLVGGLVRAMWWVERGRTGPATLVVAGSLTRRAAASVTAEGRRLLRFVAPDAEGHDVRVRRPG
jgi:hypothetical protein